MAASGSVVTRFAPSPTGFLHIGGARTALFNWLHARHHGGRFLLRIEDTDRARSTPEATEAIFAGLRWLGLDWDGDAVSQFSRVDRHAEVARDMVAAGAAYRCYATSEETEAFRAQARAAGQPPLFRSPWRDADAPTAPDAPYAIRLKAPRDGETVVDDLVQGRIAWRNETLDDLVLLRSDGTPTYMLAVVVDDHDMGITHVIRGDDHLTNTARQTLIYRALGWPLPAFAHIPLIHGPDGSKLSKRHGALGVDAYAKMGFLPVAMRNYLARLGWSHGDREFFTTEEAIEWFRIEDVGKAPARFDLKRLENLSGQHIRAAEDQALLAELEAYIAAQQLRPLTAGERSMMLRAMQGIKERSKTIPEMLDMAWFIIGRRPFRPDAGAERHLDTVSRRMLSRLTPQLRNASWDAQSLEHAVRSFAETEGMSLGKVAQPLRAALTGRTISPSVFDMMSIIGRDESLARLEDCIAAGVE